MQGAIFTIFNDLIVEKFGMAQWNELLDKTQPKSQGIYTTAQQYEDSELLDIVAALSEKTGIPTNELTKTFGHYLFSKLIAQSPIVIDKDMGVKSLLLAVGDVIHHEVARIYPGSYMPTIRLNDIDAQHADLYYQSKRKLCSLCEGLIAGAGEYFNTGLSIKHDICMHKGDDHCLMHITLH